MPRTSSKNTDGQFGFEYSEESVNVNPFAVSNSGQFGAIVNGVRVNTQTQIPMNAEASNGATVLHVSAENNHPELVRLFLSYGADINR